MSDRSCSNPIVVPKLGEGLREAVVLRFLKHPGEFVKEGEALIELETDKAVTTMEANADGVLTAWRVAPGAVVPIGAEVGAIESSAQVSLGEVRPAPGQVDHAPAPLPTPTTSSVRNDQLSPRTRALLQRHGLIEKVDQIPRQGDKLLPADVERFLAAPSTLPPAKPPRLDAGVVRQLTTLEQSQVRRFQNANTGVSATIELRVAWAAMEAYLKRQSLAPQAESRMITIIMAWCIARAMRSHPLFRTRLCSESECQVFPSPVVGIAVAAPNDALTIASVPDSAAWSDFRTTALRSLETAVDSQSPMAPETTVILSNLMPFHVHRGVPAVIAPAVATLVAGDVSWMATGQGARAEFARMFYLSLGFDHRLINGVPAAEFLHDVATRVETLPDLNLPPSDETAVLSASPLESGLRELVSRLLGIPPSLVDMGAKIADLARDSLGLVSAELICEDVYAFLTGHCPTTKVTLETLPNTSLRELVRTAL